MYALEATSKKAILCGYFPLSIVRHVLYLLSPSTFLGKCYPLFVRQNWPLFGTMLDVWGVTRSMPVAQNKGGTVIHHAGRET